MTSTGNSILRTSAIVTTALSIALLTGCSAGSEEPAAVSPTPTGASAPLDCAASDAGTPEGARTASTIDVDGDLEADEQWVTGDGEFGVTTSTGVTASVRPTGLSGGAEPGALIADVSGQGNGPVVMLVAGSRDVDLYRWTGCAFEAVTNADGDQYRFDLTGRHGTGVGCTSIDGTRQLVGLLADRPNGAPEDVDQIAVTPVQLDDTRAEPGPTTTAAPADATAGARATQVTCDDRTLADDGLGLL